MKRRTPAFALLLVLPAALLSACGVPLGPGYTVKKQQLEARWTGTPELAVRGTYRLQNTGKGPLDYIEVTLPPEPRRSGLQVTLDNSPVAPQPADELAPAGTVRIPISPALPQKKKRDLVIEYRLAGSVGDVSTTPSFYLETRGWYPALREREGLFGSGGAPPEKWDLRVTVPRDFLVHASGRPKGRKRRGDSDEHRFRQRRGQDFDPFVVAGRYFELSVRESDVKILAWTLEERHVSDLSAVTARLAKYEQTLVRVLGPAPGPLQAIRLVEHHFPNQMTPQVATAFPGGVLLAPEYFRDSLATPEFFATVGTMLASTWVSEVTRPAPEVRDHLAIVLEDYVIQLAEEELKSSHVDRTERVQERLETHRLLTRQEEEEKANGEWTGFWRGEIERSKAELFVVALEEHTGRAAFQASLKRMFLALRGSTWNTNDLRVAIQLETGEDPAEFFRLWLNQPGIPDEFRQRYQATK